MTARIATEFDTPKDRVACLPEGTYWVGDPCYFVPDELWMEYLQTGGEHYEIGGLTIQLSDGRLVAAHGTAYGDGVYKGSDGFGYGVDAGLLGVVQVLPGDNEPSEGLGTKVTFDQPFTVSYESGTVEIGHIRIDTDSDDDEQPYCDNCGGWTLCCCDGGEDDE